jgi:hypothetical protein
MAHVEISQEISVLHQGSQDLIGIDFIQYKIGFNHNKNKNII